MHIYISEFFCGVLATILTEIALTIGAAVIYTRRKDGDQCKDAASEKE